MTLKSQEFNDDEREVLKILNEQKYSLLELREIIAWKLNDNIRYEIKAKMKQIMRFVELLVDLIET